MGKIIFLALFLSMFLLDAHAPKSIDLAYDGEAAALSVKVWHKVSNQDKHYIEKISVYAGETLLAEKTYERQETADGQEEIFLFIDRPLKTGDAVKVVAICNILGKRSAVLKWE